MIWITSYLLVGLFIALFARLKTDKEPIELGWWLILVVLNDVILLCWSGMAIIWIVSTVAAWLMTVKF